ncbi:hypothetical protein GQ457_03G022310 [Hibiscus cannabinus]
MRKEIQWGTIEAGVGEKRHALEWGEPATRKGKRLHRCVTKVVAKNKLEVLDSCVVAWCKWGLCRKALVEELQRAEIRGCSVMRISGAMVLLMFATTEERQALLDRSDLDRWFARIMEWSPEIQLDSHSETFVNLAGLWDKLIRVEGFTMEPHSFERARFLIESNKMDKIEKMVEVNTGEGLVTQVQVQEVEVVHSYNIICPYEQENEEGDNVDVPGAVCEGPVTRENPLFWGEEVDRGVADEDVGLVHREVSSGKRLGELVFMEVLCVLPLVTGLQCAKGELVVTDSDEHEGLHVPLIEWESVDAQRSQKVDLGPKSPDVLKSIKNVYFELGDTEIVSNQQKRRLLKVHGKGKRGRPRKVGDKETYDIAKRNGGYGSIRIVGRCGDIGMRILSWNVRGLGSVAMRRGVRVVIRKQSWDMMFLLESKLGGVSESRDSRSLEAAWQQCMGHVMLMNTMSFSSNWGLSAAEAVCQITSEVIVAKAVCFSIKSIAL